MGVKVLDVEVRTNKTIDADGVELLRWKSILAKEAQTGRCCDSSFVYFCFLLDNKRQIRCLQFTFFGSAFIWGPGKLSL